MNTRTPQEELAVITYELHQINGELAKLSKLLMGNGNPEMGLVVRMDRLEQNEKMRGWFTKTALGTAVSAIVTAIFAMILRK